MRASSVLVLFAVSLTSAIPVDSATAVGEVANELELQNTQLVQLENKRDEVAQAATDSVFVTNTAEDSSAGSISERDTAADQISQIKDAITKQLDASTDPFSLLMSLVSTVLGLVQGLLGGLLGNLPIPLPGVTTKLARDIVEENILKRDTAAAQLSQIKDAITKQLDTSAADPLSLLSGIITTVLGLLQGLVGNLVGSAGGLPIPIPSGLPIPLPSGLPIPLPSGLPVAIPSGLPIPIPSGLPIPIPSGLPGAICLPGCIPLPTLPIPTLPKRAEN